MKKLILIISLILMVLVLASCSKGEVPKEEKIDLGKTECEANASSPIKTVNEVKDAYGNILQQILLDTRTGDMFIYDYTYKFDGVAFYCTGSWMTLIEGDIEDIEVHKPTVNTPTNDNNSNQNNNPTTAQKDELVLNSGDIKIWLVSYEYDDLFEDHIFKFKVRNTGTRSVDIRTDKEIVNGNMQMYNDIGLWETIDGNCTTYIKLYVSNYALEDFEINNFQSLTLDLIVCDTENWDGILAKETITIKPE